MNGKLTKTMKVLNFLKNYSKSLQTWGWVLVQFNIIIAIVFFWFMVFTYYEPYQQVAFVMLKFFRLAIFIFVLGFIVYYFSHFMQEIIFKRQMKKVKIEVK